MKKISKLLCIGALSLMLVGCNNKGKETTKRATNTNPTTVTKSGSTTKKTTTKVVTTEGKKIEVKFVCDEHSSVKIFETQDTTTGGVLTNTAYARDGETGKIDSTGDGQVNFIIIFDEGYKFKSCTGDNTKYGKVKGPEDTGVENCYRITKITDDVTMTIESMENTTVFEGYKVSFILDEGIKVTVYDTQDITTGGVETKEAIAKSGKSGEVVSTTDAQVNFVVNAGENGYDVAVSGEFGNKKQDPEADGSTNYFRVTKIQGDITIRITKK